MNVNWSIPDPGSEADNKSPALLHTPAVEQNHGARLARCVAKWRSVEEPAGGLLRAL